MKQGKLAENILDRSVLREIRHHRQEMIKGAATGSDCAFFAWNENTCIINTQTVSLPVDNQGALAVHMAANNLYAAAAEPVMVSLAITLPENAEEKLLKKLMQQMEAVCEELQIQIAGGHTECSEAVVTPVVTVTAVGRAVVKQQSDIAYADKDLVMSKFAGTSGTAILAKEKEKQLLARYPFGFVCNAARMNAHLSVQKEAAIALKSDVCAMHDLNYGGVFGALWDLSQKINVGLQIDLKKIPIAQETIEICEFFELNPYTLLSGGSLLMVTDNGEALREELLDHGIFAEVIGRTHKGNEKIIRNDDDIRFLDKPAPDEIHKIQFI